MAERRRKGPERPYSLGLIPRSGLHSPRRFSGKGHDERAIQYQQLRLFIFHDFCDLGRYRGSAPGVALLGAPESLATGGAHPKESRDHRSGSAVNSVA